MNAWKNEYCFRCQFIVGNLNEDDAECRCLPPSAANQRYGYIEPIASESRYPAITVHTRACSLFKIKPDIEQEELNQKLLKEADETEKRQKEEVVDFWEEGDRVSVLIEGISYNGEIKDILNMNDPVTANIIFDDGEFITDILIDDLESPVDE